MEDLKGVQQTCPKCGSLFTQARPRFLARLKFCDETAEIDVNFFGENFCKDLFEMGEQELYALS